MSKNIETRFLKAAFMHTSTLNGQKLWTGVVHVTAGAKYFPYVYKKSYFTFFRGGVLTQ